MTCCFGGCFRRPHKSAEMPSRPGMLMHSMMMSFIPGQSSDELIVLNRRHDGQPRVQAWHSTAPELTHLLALTEPAEPAQDLADMSEACYGSESVNGTSSYALDAGILLKSMKVVYIFTDKSGSRTISHLT